MSLLSIFKKDFQLSKNDEKKIIAAITQAEKSTSGEIRLHIDDDSPEDVFEAAAIKFLSLQMQKTKDRNGVLFYLTPKNKKFAIVADEGINKVVPEDFWDSIKEQMQADFKKNNFLKGITQGILTTGICLKNFFTLAEDDTNELSNEISR